MSVLDATILHPFRDTENDADESETLDLRGEIVRLDRRPDGGPDSDPESSPEPGPSARRSVRPTRPRLPDGVRIRRIRLGSAAMVAAVFSTVGYLVVLGTLVTCWNVVQRLGFVTDLEEAAITSLGLESFVVDGQQLFELAAVVLGAAFALVFVMLVLLSLVFNATCALFGGVALEVGPLRRTRRVFSPRHRRFISV